MLKNHQLRVMQMAHCPQLAQRKELHALAKLRTQTFLLFSSEYLSTIAIGIPTLRMLALNIGVNTNTAI